MPGTPCASIIGPWKRKDIELEPGKKIGVGRERQADESLPRHVAERIAAQERMARENGEAILADPMVALAAITHQRATFTEHDLAKFLHTRTPEPSSSRRRCLKVTTSNELVALGKDDFNRMRYTTRDDAGGREVTAAALASHGRFGAAHGVDAKRQAAVLARIRFEPRATRGVRARDRGGGPEGPGRSRRQRQEHDARSRPQGLGGGRLDRQRRGALRASPPRIWRSPPASNPERSRATSGPGTRSEIRSLERCARDR